MQIHFKSETLERLTSEVKGRFLAPNDNLYKIGDWVDGIYIIKNGILKKEVIVDIEYANRWPI